MTSRLLPALALVVAVGLFFAYINPTWLGSIAAAKAAIANDNQALAAAKDFAARQNELAAARDAIDPTDLNRLTAFLPDSVDNVGLVLDLNALAARSGLSLSNLDVAQASDSGPVDPNTGLSTDPVGSVDLTLSAVGTFAALQNFLTGIESSERLLDVTLLGVTGSDTGVYTYHMSIRIYWLR